MNIAEEQTLKAVPVKRQYTKWLNIMPGVVDTKYNFTQGNNVHGSSSRQNTGYTMDGGHRQSVERDQQHRPGRGLHPGSAGTTTGISARTAMPVAASSTS